jgi:hypothetical protein
VLEALVEISPGTVCPQRLKPEYKFGIYGTAEAVPLSKTEYSASEIEFSASKTEFFGTVYR